jgi:hypothetical protein
MANEFTHPQLPLRGTRAGPFARTRHRGHHADQSVR